MSTSQCDTRNDRMSCCCLSCCGGEAPDTRAADLRDNTERGPPPALGPSLGVTETRGSRRSMASGNLDPFKKCATCLDPVPSRVWRAVSRPLDRTAVRHFCSPLRWPRVSGDIRVGECSLFLPGGRGPAPTRATARVWEHRRREEPVVYRDRKAEFQCPEVRRAACGFRAASTR